MVEKFKQRPWEKKHIFDWNRSIYLKKTVITKLYFQIMQFLRHFIKMSWSTQFLLKQQKAKKLLTFHWVIASLLVAKTHKLSTVPAVAWCSKRPKTGYHSISSESHTIRATTRVYFVVHYRSTSVADCGDLLGWPPLAGTPPVACQPPRPFLADDALGSGTAFGVGGWSVCRNMLSMGILLIWWASAVMPPPSFDLVMLSA